MSGQDEPERKRNLADAVADALRERVFALDPGTRLGSLQDLAAGLGVGIVTLQQAARVLEHEGLLEARRGPGGGYYGRRPDVAALERTMSAYMRMNPASYEEALDMTSLLFTELASAAAGCRDPELQAALRELDVAVMDCESAGDFGAFEARFQDLLFKMVRRPLFEMLTRVTMNYAGQRPDWADRALHFERDSWIAGRRRIIAAILANDPPLARFEAQRSNRDVVLARLAAAIT